MKFNKIKLNTRQKC